MVGIVGRARLLRFVLGGLGLAGCTAGSETDRRIFLLMECEECVSGEEDSVVALGSAAVLTLENRLERGPPEPAIARYRAFLYDRDRALSRSPNPPLDSTSYANRYLDLYRASYRIRSARALARIGGPRAREALVRAVAAYPEPSVNTALRFALDSVWHP